jgi:excinuclease ABC subunit A
MIGEAGMNDSIVIRGAREHNLKDLTLTIPRDAITVITGPSGSGKSSLAIDTIYAEGQRRYVESLSPYARQFLEQTSKPDVDSIEGLSPSICIDQKTVKRSMRSTVGTITEVYDYMRVLYTRIGKPYCYKCGDPISAQDTESILSTVMSLPRGSRLQILAPIVRDRKGEYKKELAEMRAEGFVRARIDGEMVDLTQDIKLKKHSRHTIEIVIDRLIIKRDVGRALKAAIDSALRFSDTVIINLIDDGRDIPLSRTMACGRCGISYPELNPRFFSFNSRLGACPRCRGLGVLGIDEAEEDDSDDETLQRTSACPACHGMRLRPEALSVKVGGLSIGEFSRLDVLRAVEFIHSLILTERERLIASRIQKEVGDRLSFLRNVGLGYLSLDRTSATLSGGEAQRIRLATQMGSSLTGVLYVLDEPSMGLHPRDCRMLLESLVAIRDAGNTVIIVEHDEDTIRMADHVVDIGPGAGRRGGWVTAQGSPDEIVHNEKSLTGKYLSGALRTPRPSVRREPSGFIEIRGASAFNLKGIDASIPLGAFTCVTGVSGSGKSTLVFEVLEKALRKAISGSLVEPGAHIGIEGVEQVDRVIRVEQTQLGRTPRSNPATYTGTFTLIRNLFSQVPDARVRGYSSSRFSFNLHGGRCENCGGDGMKKIEMHFLPNVYVPCDQCKGRRYNRETLDIRYKGKTIADVLAMTVSEAREFFSAVPPLRQRLEVVEDVGLGYIALGQPAPTLSGGEAQRLRLSREFGKRATGRTLYILDEPTTGLHFVDIERLLSVIQGLVDRGNTVIVIEHNLDVIKAADRIIDLGPEGGEAGGTIVAAGTPEEVAASPGSHTGRHLKERLVA